MEGQYVSASGYFYVQNQGITPQELQGLLIRIRNAALGGYDPTFMGFSPSIGTIFQTWISAEIHADDRLEDAMNIDRRTLRVVHPAYVELQRELHDYLAKLIKRARAEIYGSASKARAASKAKDFEEDITDLANSDVARISPSTGRELKSAWKNASDDDDLRRKLLKKYTVNQFYRIVISIAAEILTPNQFNKFITKLTERLRE
jgi:vacuolar-type H+-ATPase subunit H